MIRIGVFMGGPSIEREVSFNSGRTICDYIDKSKYIVVSLFVTEERKIYILPWQFVHRGKIIDFEDRLIQEAVEIKWQDIGNYIDFAYLALHGTLGEDGVMQGFFEILNIPYTGSSVEANAISMNKFFTHNFLYACKINTPEICVFRLHSKNYTDAEMFFNKFKQVIVKPIHEGSSLGVTYVKNNEKLIPAIHFAMCINKAKEQDVIVQKYIYGKEFTVIAVEKNNNWQVFSPTEIENNFPVFTYEKKYLPGAVQKHTPARFSEDILYKIEKNVKIILDNLQPNDIMRIDGIVENITEEIYFLDLNTFPGTAPASYVFLQAAYAGYSNAGLINHVIENSISRYLVKNSSLNINNQLRCISEKKSELLNKKINIAIFLGGDTNEREVSLESGRNVFYTISESFFAKKAIFVSSKKEFYLLTLSQLTKDTTEAIEMSLVDSQKIIMKQIKEQFDFVFIALHGGYGEDGTLQKELENLAIPYNGSNSLSSAVTMNKYVTARILSDKGFVVPEQLLIDKNNRDFLYEKKYIEYLLWRYKKIIIKPHDDGCSANIFSADEYRLAVNIIDEFWKISKKEFCLIEGAIKGIELTIGCFGNQPDSIPLPITETIKNNIFLSLEEKFLPGCGENITPARLNKQVTYDILMQLKQAYKLLNCDGYIRMDCFWLPEEEKLVFLECNSLPALTPATCLFHQAAEIDLTPQEFLHYIIYLGFEKHNQIVLYNNHFFVDALQDVCKKIKEYQVDNSSLS